MQHKFLIYLLVFGLLLPLAFATVDIDRVTCGDNGQIQVTVMVTNEVGKIEAANLQLSAKTGLEEYTIPPGNWDKEFVYNNLAAEKTYLVFTTPEMYANLPQDYRFKLIRKGTEEISIKNVACPGFRYSCAMFDLAVDSCNTYNGTFTAVFKAEGYEDGQLLSTADLFNIYDDITYTVGAKERFCDTDGFCSALAGLPDKAVIEYQGDDIYKLTWKTDNNMVETFGIEVTNSSACQEDPNYAKSHFFANALCTSDPFYEPPNSCDGCETTDGVCLPAESIVKQNGVMKYCSPYGKLITQKRTGVSCKHDYECQTDYCDTGACAEPYKPLTDCGEDIPLLNDCKCGFETFRYEEGVTQYCCDDTLSLNACGSAAGTGDGSQGTAGIQEGETTPTTVPETSTSSKRSVFGIFFDWLKSIFS